MRWGQLEMDNDELEAHENGMLLIAWCVFAFEFVAAATTAVGFAYGAATCQPLAIAAAALLLLAFWCCHGRHRCATLRVHLRVFQVSADIFWQKTRQNIFRRKKAAPTTTCDAASRTTPTARGENTVFTGKFQRNIFTYFTPWCTAVAVAVAVCFNHFIE